MELKEQLNKFEIIGVISEYKSTYLNKEYIKELNIKNIRKALVMVGLDESFLNKKVGDLTISEELKLELATKLNDDIIIIGNLSKRLINKDLEYIKKLLLKLNNDYHKKIVIVDEDVNVFMNIVKKIYVIENKKIIYSTDDFFDDLLYEYVKTPKIIDFIKYVNKDKERIDQTTDIYELIKDIYRRVS